MPGSGEAYAESPAALKDSSVVIYLGPGGADMWGLVGAAVAMRIHTVGVAGPKELAWLCRRVSRWFPSVEELLDHVSSLPESVAASPEA